MDKLPTSTAGFLPSTVCFSSFLPGLPPICSSFFEAMLDEECIVPNGSDQGHRGELVGGPQVGHLSSGEVIGTCESTPNCLEKDQVQDF